MSKRIKDNIHDNPILMGLLFVSILVIAILIGLYVTELNKTCDTSNNTTKIKSFDAVKELVEGSYSQNDCKINYTIDNKNKKIDVNGNYDEDKCKDFRNNMGETLFAPYNEISKNGSILDNIKQGKKIITL